MAAAVTLSAAAGATAQPFSFRLQGTTTLGGNLVAATSADFNHDGNRDLAVVNQATARVSLLLGNGDGTFQTAIDYSTGVNPGSIAAGDWNGDGEVDLAVLCQGIGSAAEPGITIFFGAGDGSFQSGGYLPVNGSPTAIATADFNGDGRPDLVVGYGSSANPPFTVLLSGGDGTFSPLTPLVGGQTREVTQWTQVIAVGDLNRDGKLDIVMGPRLESPEIIRGSGLVNTVIERPGPHGVISIALGNGDGTFEPAKSLKLGDSLFALAAADFDGDRVLDLALLDDHGDELADGTLLLLRGDGEGAFLPPVVRSLGFHAPSALAIGDANGDKVPDLFIPQFSFVWRFCGSGGCITPPWPPQESALWVFQGNGDGTFLAEKDNRFEAPLDAFGKNLHCVDLDNDGTPDLVLLNTGTISVWVSGSGKSN